MNPTDRAAFEALNARIDHTAAIARMLSRVQDGDVEMTNAIRGIAETLTELAGRLDALVNPPLSREGC